MSRIQQLIEPGRRTASGKIAFPLIGVAAACIALYAQAQAASPAAATFAPPNATNVPAPAVSRGPVLETHAAVAQLKNIEANDTDKAFALVRKGVESISMSGSTDDIDAIKAARANVDSDFLWFRRGDRAYVVVDPTTVARAKAAWRDVDKLSPRMEELGKQMEVHGTKLEQLGAKMEQLSAHRRATPAMEDAARRMAQLGVQQQGIAKQQARLSVEMMDADEAQREKLQARMDVLTEQMDAMIGLMDEQNEVLEAQTEQLEASQQPMEALGDQMEEASRPMEALGEQMEALGEQQEKHVRIAERELEKLIDAALEQGLAKPAPGRASHQ